MRYRNWYNKLGVYKTYEELDSKTKWCLIELRSHNDEDMIQKNFLTLAFGSKYRVFRLPFQLIKPLYDYSNYEYDGDDYYQIGHKKLREMNLPVKFKMYVVNHYTFSIFENHVSIGLRTGEFLYNDDDHKPIVDWFWFVPWKTRERSLQYLLNIDGSLYFNATDTKGKRIPYDEVWAKEETQEVIKFAFKDFDDEDIVVTCKREYSEYSLGGSSMFWKWVLGFFTKPNTYNTLRLEFNKEVGARKGSWKGGTMGHAVDMLEGETPEEAFKRYCVTPELRGSRQNVDTNMKFIGALK